MVNYTNEERAAMKSYDKRCTDAQTALDRAENEYYLLLTHTLERACLEGARGLMAWYLRSRTFDGNRYLSRDVVSGLAYDLASTSYNATERALVAFLEAWVVGYKANSRAQYDGPEVLEKKAEKVHADISALTVLVNAIGLTYDMSSQKREVIFHGPSRRPVLVEAVKGNTKTRTVRIVNALSGTSHITLKAVKGTNAWVSEDGYTNH